MKILKALLKVVSLPLVIPVGTLLGLIGIIYLCYLWVFKPTQLIERLLSDVAED